MQDPRMKDELVKIAVPTTVHTFYNACKSRKFALGVSVHPSLYVRACVYGQFLLCVSMRVFF